MCTPLPRLYITHLISIFIGVQPTMGLFIATHVVTACCLPTVVKSIKNYVYAL